MSIIVFLRRNGRTGPINLIQGLATTSTRSKTTRGYEDHYSVSHTNGGLE